MKLEQFYAKDENVISMVWDKKEGRADIVIDPCWGTEDKQSGLSLYSTKSMMRYSVPCSLKSFTAAVSRLDTRKANK